MDLLHEQLDLEILNVIGEGFPRRIYDRKNYFEEMDNATFFRRFRLTKRTVLNILAEIEHQLEYQDDR